LSLIARGVKKMARAEDPRNPCSKNKALVTLLPYAVLQERDGRPEMLDMLLHTARASGTLMFAWYHAKPTIVALLSKATPRAIVLASPSIVWCSLNDGGVFGPTVGSSNFCGPIY